MLDIKINWRIIIHHMDDILVHIGPYARATWFGAGKTFAFTLFFYYISIASLGFGVHDAWWSICAWIIFRALVVLRIFIIVHDCSHYALFPSMCANSWIGILLGGVVLTPIKQWRRGHNYHHQNSGNLLVVCLEHAIKSGDTIFLTRAEWDNMKGWKRTFLRYFRSPLHFFTIVPLLLFFVAYRIPGRVTKVNTYLTTFLKLLEVSVIMYVWHNINFLWMEFIALWMTAIAGMMLFHLQHGVNKGYRVINAEYNAALSSIHGATFLTFIPWYLKWATLGIEYHHIHHLNTRVPCYRLANCHESAPDGTWKDVNHVSFREAIFAMSNVMWNEKTQLYESF